MLLSPAIKALVKKKYLTKLQAENLFAPARQALEDAEVRELIYQGSLTMAQVGSLSYFTSAALREAGVRKLIADGILQMAQVLALNHVESVALSHTFTLYYNSSDYRRVLNCIREGTLTMAHILAMPFECSIEQLMNPNVGALIRAGRLTPAHIAAIRYKSQIYNVGAPGVCDLISAGIMTVEQAFGLSYHQSGAFRDADTRQRLINGDLTLDDIIGVAHGRPHAQGVAAIAHNINDRQSTHHASVHQTVSESASQLAQSYQLMIDGAGLENVVSMVQSYVKSLPDGSQQNTAAKQCVLRITAPDYTFTDPGSQITMRHLLALTFLAIHDGGKRVGSLKDARAQFVEGLYEIQRGYNLSDMGVDRGGPDKSICTAGTFNKLVEKLQGIHPDGQIRFITSETAALKLPIVVREEAMRYFESNAQPNTVEALHEFTQLMSQVKEEGVGVIWDQIKDTVAKCMFDEFRSLYQGRDDPLFIGFIEAGQDIELPDLSVFQEKVQSSKGYHQYCNQLLRRPGMFFSHKKSTEYLSEHRHDSPEAQREYDQRCGLMLSGP